MPGIIAAVMLGIGRVIGETMAVLMVTGNAAAIPSSIFDPVRTLTATIAAEMGETQSPLKWEKQSEADFITEHCSV